MGYLPSARSLVSEDRRSAAVIFAVIVLFLSLV